MFTVVRRLALVALLLSACTASSRGRGRNIEAVAPGASQGAGPIPPAITPSRRTHRATLARRRQGPQSAQRLVVWEPKRRRGMARVLRTWEHAGRGVVRWEAWEQPRPRRGALPFDYRPTAQLRVPSTGTWTVMHGGPTRAINSHHRSVEQRYAYDFEVRIRGRRSRGLEHRNEDFFCYGRPLLAPADGVVIFARDGVPDNKPGIRGTGGGNGVILDHGAGERSALWHAIPGSIRVKVGQRVVAGQELGRVGNSGQSTHPHIHMHLYFRDKDRNFAIPARFDDVIVNGHRVRAAMPIRGEQIRHPDPPTRLPSHSPAGAPSDTRPSPAPSRGGCSAASC